MGSERLAAIDIGTVTCRMLLADVRAGRVIPLAREYAITNLGEGVDATGLLRRDAMERVAAAIDRFLAVRDAFDTLEEPVLKTLVMATSASRDAKNAGEFAALIAQRGLELMVIPGKREAALSFAGAASEFPAGERIAVVDIGGGSTEVVIGRAGGAAAAADEPLAAHSFDVGCRRVTERFLDEDPPSPAAIREARTWIRGQFEPRIASLMAAAGTPDRMVAVAGTATSAVSMRDAMEVYDSERVHGARVTREEVAELLGRLAALPLPEREQVTGLDPGRAPVIVAGMLILEEVMRALGAAEFTASESDILQGIILSGCRQPS